MNGFELSPIVESPASGPGALAGFETTCSCGLVLKSSLRSLIEADAAEHADWHARQAARAERIKSDIVTMGPEAALRKAAAAVEPELGVGDVVEQVGYDVQFTVVGKWRGYLRLVGPAGTEHKAPRSELTLVERAPRPSVDERGTVLLVTTAHPSMKQHTLDGDLHPNLGRLITPRHTSSIEKTAGEGIPWAADNDCFQGLDADAYTRMIDRIAGLPGCMFVTVPDVVADVEATFEQFDRWIVELEARGLPAALVAQDGLELELDRVQWDRIAAVFIGGSTEWKESAAAVEVAREARRRGKLVHWGRVNTRRRFDLIVASGVADSFDGSKWARFRTTYLNTGLSWAHETSGREQAAMPVYRFELDAEASDETDATIVAEVLVGAIRDERNYPAEPVACRYRLVADSWDTPGPWATGPWAELDTHVEGGEQA